MPRTYNHIPLYKYGPMQKAGGAGKQEEGLGPELITSSPDFAAGEWTFDNPPWNIPGTDLLTIGGASGGDAASNVSLTNGTTYRVTWNVQTHALGTYTLLAGSTTGNTYTSGTTGEQTEDIVYTTAADPGILFRATAAVIVSTFTSISVKEVL